MKNLFATFFLFFYLTGNHPSQAGNIGFLVNYINNDNIQIVNQGNSSAYQLSIWSLNNLNQWHRLLINTQDTATLSPAMTLSGVRNFLPSQEAIGKHDPVLIIYYDQAGSQFAQLAWRIAPIPETRQLYSRRKGASLEIRQTDPQLVESWAIVVPHDGIEALTHPFSPLTSLPAPIRHVWKTGEDLSIDSGKGQAGAWIVSKDKENILSVHIFPDGITRGNEQIPAWLTWIKNYLLSLSFGIMVAGIIFITIGIVQKNVKKVKQ
jgi:hypothetical protein